MTDTPTASRRQFLGAGLAAALAPVSSAPLRPSPAAPQGEAAGGRRVDNPLGDRWPRPDERYFYGPAADRRDMQRINARITPGDVDAFVAAWGALADAEEQRAARAAAENRHVTARDYWLRASNYRSQIQNLFLRLGRRDDMVRAHDRMTTAFRQAWQHVPAPFERVEIPFGTTSLPALFFPTARGRSASRRGAAVLELSGIDHIKERVFFRSQWLPFVDRDLAYLSIDAPGQGESVARGLYLRPDSEVAAIAAIDYLVSRPDVDPARIGVFGTSFGGYFAPRAAAADRRIKAMASRSSVYDAAEDAFDFCPTIRQQLRLLVDAPTLDAARERLRAFTVRGRAGTIRCPVYITHGSKDDIVSVEAARKLDAEIVARRKRVEIIEGAGHNPGQESETSQIDWIASLL